LVKKRATLVLQLSILVFVMVWGIDRGGGLWESKEAGKTGCKVGRMQQGKKKARAMRERKKILAL